MRGRPAGIDADADPLNPPTGPRISADPPGYCAVVM
jgi:hypothetical protein